MAPLLLARGTSGWIPNRITAELSVRRFDQRVIGEDFEGTHVKRLTIWLSWIDADVQSTNTGICSAWKKAARFVDVLSTRPHSISRLSNRLSNGFDSRLNVCIHDTTGCQSGLTTGLTTGCIV